MLVKVKQKTIIAQATWIKPASIPGGWAEALADFSSSLGVFLCTWEPVLYGLTIGSDIGED